MREHTPFVVYDGKKREECRGYQHYAESAVYNLLFDDRGGKMITV